MSRKAHIETTKDFILLKDYCLKYILFKNLMLNLSNCNYSLDSISNMDEINYYFCCFDSIKSMLNETDFEILHTKFIVSPNISMKSLMLKYHYEKYSDFAKKFNELISTVINMLNALRADIDLEIITKDLNSNIYVSAVTKKVNSYSI